jgi:hypothetical protein
VAELVGDREAAARLGLGGVDEDAALGREEHAAHVELAHLDRKAEQVLSDRLDRDRELRAAEDRVVLRAACAPSVRRIPKSYLQLITQDVRRNGRGDRPRLRAPRPL